MGAASGKKLLVALTSIMSYSGNSCCIVVMLCAGGLVGLSLRPNLQNPHTMEKKNNFRSPIFVSFEGCLKRIDVESILYLESHGDKCIIYLEDKQQYEVHMPMKESLERIQDERLIRIHRSFTVNFDQIDKAYPGMVLLNGGSQVPIGRDYSDVFAK